MTKRTLDRPLSALDAIFTRRSVRDYLPDHIDKSTVRGLLDAAVQAPTAIHAQPWLFAVVQGSAVLRRLSERAKEEWRRAEDLGIPADVTAFAPIIVGVPAGDAALVSRNEPVVISWR